MKQKTLPAWIVARFQRVRLRTQLLVAVNLSVAVVLAGFLVVDYRESVRLRMKEKAVALSDEARTIGVAVDVLQQLGPDAVQQHIDAVCHAMNAAESPGHTIEVALGTTIFDSNHSTHSPDHNSPWSAMVEGAAVVGEVRVRVGERRKPVILEVRRAELRRIGAVGIAALIGAGMLNLLLVRLVTLPLERTVRTIRVIGSGQLGEVVQVRANRELSELAGEVSKMSRELAAKERDRRAQLDRARRLQSHLIPSPSGDHGVGVAIEYHPVDEVAGDFVDVLTCPNGDTLLCVADVVGHGIHAAMGSAALKALLLATDLDEPSPAEMLAAINQRYSRTNLPEDFASMVLVRVCANSGRAVYASAGHELGYVRHADGRCDEIGSTGMVLGVIEEARCEDAEINLEPGDLLVLLSDGVIEAANSEGKLLGRRAVGSLVRDSGTMDAASLAGALIEAANTHRGNAPLLDDMTILAFTFTPVQPASSAEKHKSANEPHCVLSGSGGHNEEDDRVHIPDAEKEIV